MIRKARKRLMTAHPRDRQRLRHAKDSKLRIDLITLFPKLVEAPLSESMARQAQKRGLIEIHIHNLRDYALDKRRTCDDKPFGGGAGMVMMIQPIFDCLADISGKPHRIFASPRGEIFGTKIAKRLSRKQHLVFICGHYEGVDERVHKHLVDEEFSVGDFVLTGGELPTLCMIDAIIRFIPGVLGNAASLDHESFARGVLDFPQYTTPRNFKGWKVPGALLSGNHKRIEAWREKEALRLTETYRPDLIR